MLKPTIQAKNFVSFLTSKESIVAISAIVVTPLILQNIRSIVAKTPFLQENFVLGLIIAAFALFVIAGFLPSGILRLLVLGVAIGTAIAAVAPFFEPALGGLFGSSS